MAARSRASRPSSLSSTLSPHNHSRLLALHQDTPKEPMRPHPPVPTSPGHITAGIAIGCVLAFVPFYYLFHSTKPAASGNAAITEARRQGDPSTEYRDPRDSPVKTLEQQKKVKAQGGGQG
ncbi:hypothetical protein AYO21_11591 [Fonsecaea monophora]|uniref:Uncharacterized protein n=1 Tax=Fonsecaea monophora TaxID=254056 RepID=A0A177EQG6_9EURO|nr:hypothetical protein AYO21_11591 [Fonsecaea monophora]OAG34244.1 hypothetical protein AYO21_11591 [Fonsecaea monophora]